MNTLKHKVDAWLPITKSVLQNITRDLPIIFINEFETTLFSAAFSLVFHGFLSREINNYYR